MIHTKSLRRGFDKINEIVNRNEYKKTIFGCLTRRIDKFEIYMETLNLRIIIFF